MAGRVPFLVALLLGMGAGRGATAQDLPAARRGASGTLAAPPDSVAAGSPTATKNTVPSPSSALGRAAAGAQADSTGVGGAAAAARADSAGVGGTGAAAGPPIEPPWVRSAVLDDASLEGMRVQTLPDALEAVPGTAIRVAGDRGAPVFWSLAPVGLPAPELYVDGIPSRSPADLDAALWDRSLMGMGAVEAVTLPGAAWFGETALYLRSRPAQDGRTVMRTHFTQAPQSSNLRALSLTTPHAARSLRFDFEEWVTEEGIDFVDDPALSLSVSNFGRSKMRRFRVGGDVDTERGRLSFRFGRGRRGFRGTVGETGSVERWTGELAVGLEHQDAAGLWQVRGYHLDWHDDDAVHNEVRDATRLGVIVHRIAQGGGLFLHARGERWSARFSGPQSSAAPDPAYVGRVRFGYRSPEEAAWGLDLGVEAAGASHTRGALEPGGGGSLRWRGGGFQLRAAYARTLRTPTLLETDGTQTLSLRTRTVPAFQVTRQPAGALPHEKQDVLRLEVGWEGRRGSAGARLERWWLREGIGWRPDNGALGAGGTAQTVGGLEMEVDQVVGWGRWRLGSWRHGLAVDVQGQRVLGRVERAASRGGGWPRSAVWLQGRWWHRLFGDRDFAGLTYRFRFLDERFDDTLAPYGVRVPRLFRHDLRLHLRLRDAELYLAVYNLLDRRQEEVSGTRRRGRELIWGLAWPFFN